MEKHVESKYFFTKFGHFYFLFLLYFTCTSIITFGYIYIYIYIICCTCMFSSYFIVVAKLNVRVKQCMLYKYKLYICNNGKSLMLFL